MRRRKGWHSGLNSCRFTHEFSAVQNHSQARLSAAPSSTCPCERCRGYAASVGVIRQGLLDKLLVRGRMRRLVSALVFSAMCAPFSFADERPVGTNCRLQTPPRQSGELESSGPTWRVYPRAVDVGSQYSGCQTVWAPAENKKWSVVLKVVIEKGKPVGTWPPPNPPPPANLSCEYEGGRLLPGHSNHCPELVKSRAHGCTAKMKPLSPVPKECAYDLGDL